MSNSRIGRELLVQKVKEALKLDTKKEAEFITNTIISCIEETLVDNLSLDNFSMKLNSLGKFTVKHTPPTMRVIPFTGELKHISEKRKVRFTSLGTLRKLSKTN
jgi:nucleoid DNA-binding protein